MKARAGAAGHRDEENRKQRHRGPQRIPKGPSLEEGLLDAYVPAHGSEAVRLPSLQARDLASRLLARIGLPGVELRREDRSPGRAGPPVVLLDGRILEGMLVSWSHDGDWVAVTVGQTSV